ncbi:MAG: response regulator [Mariprofundaceae bacterium]
MLVENRRQSMSLVLLASMLCLLLFVPTHLMAHCCYTLVGVELALAAVLMVMYWLLRHGRPLEQIETSLMVCAIILFSVLSLSESLENTGAFWAAGFPFVSYFIKPVRQARYWVLLFCLEIAGAALLAKLQLITTPYTPLQLACLTIVVGFFWLLAHIYQSQYEAQRHRLHASYKQLDSHRSRLKTILDHAPNSIWMTDMQGKIHFANKAMELWTGIDEVTLRKAEDYTTLLPEAVAKRSRLADRQCLQGEQEVYYSQESMPDHQGKMRTFDLIRVKLRDGSGNLTGLVGFAIDISERLAIEIERQDLERQMLHMQRLESLGMMAGGVAHDFNNLLTAMQGSIDLARMDQEFSQEGLESLQSIETAIQAATDLCQQMLAYSGKGFVTTEVLNLNDMFENIRPLLTASIGKNIKFDFEPGDNLPAVDVDKGQIRQIILNMVINAGEAIGENAGHVIIKSSSKEISAPQQFDLMPDMPLAPGAYVVFEVCDDGPGMSEEIQTHIFDPFYTTKFTGRGLGMSAVLGIVRAHHGALEVNSAPGHGTTMRVWLPASDQAAPEAVRPAEHKSAKPSGKQEQRGCVLVIDDEPDVMRVATRMLEHMGLNVLGAGDGNEGISQYQAHQDMIDWVLLDMTMPNMNGQECLQKLRQLNPGVYVVMSSGYNQDHMGISPEAGAALEKPQDFLKKPYSLASLREVCERALSH